MLVVLVVFLFLGSLRATIIPAIAVPGQPHRHLRRSARHRLFRQHRLAPRPGARHRHRRRRRHRRGRERRARAGRGANAHPARGDEEGDERDYRAHRRDLAGASLGFRTHRLHSRRVRPAIPTICRDDQRGHADLGPKRAHPFAGALQHLFAPWRVRGAASWVGCWAGSTGCATGSPGSSAGYSPTRSCLIAVVAVLAGGIYLLSLRTPTGFLPEEDQGAFFMSIQLPDGASVPRTKETVRQVEKLLLAMPQVAATFRRDGFLATRRRQRIQQRLHGGEAETLCRARGGAGLGAGADPQGVRRGPADPHGLRHCIQSATDHRPVDLRRVRVPDGGAGGPGPRPERQRDAGPARSGQQEPDADPRLLNLYGDDAVGVPRHRPRQGAGARRAGVGRSSTRSGPRSAAATSTTSICSAVSGRSTSRARPTTAARSRTSGRSTCATKPTRWCRCARSPRAAPYWDRRSSPATTTIGRFPSTARPRSGRLVGYLARRSWPTSPTRRCRRAIQLRVDRHGLPGTRGRFEDGRDPGAGDTLRLFSSSSRSTRAG